MFSYQLKTVTVKKIYMSICKCVSASLWEQFGSFELGYSAEEEKTRKWEERGWVMTGPQRNVECSQHQLTSALCWTAEEKSVKMKKKENIDSNHEI